MKGVGIRGILIIEKGSGLPLLYQRLDPRLTDIDPVLVAGFLGALQSFSKEIVDQQAGEFQVDYGKRLMTLVTGKYTIFSAFSDKVTSEIVEILRELQAEFEKRYYESSDRTISGVVDNLSQFDEFRQIIVEQVGIQNISENWVPEFTSQNAASWLTENLRSLINGKNDINLIVQNSDIPSDKVLKVITHMWTSGDIVFRNLLEPTDILISTRNLYKYIKTNSPEQKELLSYSEELARLLPEVVSHLDGRTSVKNLIDQFQPRVYRLLDYLFEKGAVEVLSPEKKRILWSKEILDLAIQRSLKFYKSEKIIAALRAAGQQLEKPEIMSEIRIWNSQIDINYSFEMYEGLTPRQVSDLHTAWLELIRRFIRGLPDHKKTNFIKALADSVQEDFFSKYSEKEMAGFDEISFFLEELLAFSS
ncbi:MAG: hypothetical protein K9W43_11465 [Candidatus Thorarchaeota archaeon]|nr:hypothetical protein [Candidatus Thorarchaeota archaeon]